MADIFKGELQDHLGNTVYNHSEADVIFCTDGETVQEKLNRTENTLGNASGKSGSLEVNDPNILATTEATHELAENQGGCKLSYENGEFYVQAGADAASKKKLGSGGKLYCLGIGRTFNIATIVGSENVGKYTNYNFIAVPYAGASLIANATYELSDKTPSATAVFTSGAVAYDASTGTVTVSGFSLGTSICKYENGSGAMDTKYTDLTVAVYFVDTEEIVNV